MAGFNMDDYVDVAERVQQFYAKYPDGRLCTALVKFCQWPGDGIYAAAEAYRTPDDPKPGVGTAWEPVPGKTSFTRDSEVQNAETAAWGRAIAAVGIATKKLASADEVRARQPESPRSVLPRPARAPKASSSAAAPPTGDEHERVHAQAATSDLKLPPEAKGVISAAQVKKMWTMARGYGLGDDQVKEIVVNVGGVDSSKLIPRAKFEAVLREIELTGRGVQA
jgi:hypothetical protein